MLLKKTDSEIGDVEENAGNIAKIDGIEEIEIGEITLKESESDEADAEIREKNTERKTISKEELEAFRRQLALVFAMDEEKLEVILVD